MPNPSNTPKPTDEAADDLEAAAAAAGTGEELPNDMVPSGGGKPTGEAQAAINREDDPPA